MSLSDAILDGSDEYPMNSTEKQTDRENQPLFRRDFTPNSSLYVPIRVAYEADSGRGEKKMDKGNPFVGRWTYRSFHNDPELSKEFNELRFGTGALVLDEPGYGRLSGSLGGEGWSLSLVGGYTFGNPFTLRFQGSGDIGGER
jgi:hypothetical protein